MNDPTATSPTHNDKMVTFGEREAQTLCNGEQFNYIQDLE
jgi:hypothetical protein